MRKRQTWLTAVAAVLALLILAACGGGGGGGTAGSNPTNSAPISNAGPDQNISTGSVVTLNGSGSSDANGDTLNYAWSFISKPDTSTATLTGATTVNPSFTADKDGSYVIQLIVNDGKEDSTADTVTITAATGNSAPVANAGPDQNVSTGSPVTLSGSGSSDANGDTLTYSWSFISKPQLSAATLTGGTTVNPTFTPDRDGSYVVQLIVNDGTVNSTADTVTISAATANSAPVANAGPDQNVNTGSQVTLNGSSSSDSDGDTLTYTWSFTSTPADSAAILNGRLTANPKFNADKNGVYVVQLIVNDGKVDSSADTVTITATTPNSTPVSNAGPDQVVETGTLVSLDGSGSSDANGDALTYSWTFTSKPAGSGATLANASAVNPTFTADADGSYVLQLVVNDGTVDSVADSVTVAASTTAGTWSPTSVSGAPTSRIWFTAVWSGTQMLVWGGREKSGYNYVNVNTGGKYDPAADTWTAMNTMGAPEARYYNASVWTGTEMLIWGGYGATNLNTGGKYNPGTNAWTSMSTTGAPSARNNMTTVWTGTKMIVWGGYNTTWVNSGGIYDPATDTWTAISTTGAPSARAGHTAVWTGTRMLIWGGYDGTNLLNTGGIYDPATDTWTAISTTSVPSPRSLHTAVWTGSKMIVWGGGVGTSMYTNTGGIYDPSSDTWTVMSTTGAPAERNDHSAVWTGTGQKMMVWGGFSGTNYLKTGGIYDPATDTWTAMSTAGAPSNRSGHAAVWTGTEMAVWGGSGASGAVNSGGKYLP